MSDMNVGQMQSQQFFCRLYIKGQEIGAANILSVTIREWVLDILPKIEIELGDMGALLEVITLEDNDEITISIAKHSESEELLTMTFLLNDYYVSVKSDNRMLNIKLTGYMKISDAFSAKTKSYPKRSSVDVLNTIARDSGLNFLNRYNINTNDTMNWYQIHKSNIEFIKHILKRSYLFSDVLFMYGDHNNRFVYTSLNKEIDKKDSKVAKFDVSQYESKTDITDHTIYYNSYDLLNMAGYYNKISSYGTKVEYYDMKDGKDAVCNTSKKMTDLTFIDKKYSGKAVDIMQGGSFNNLNLYSTTYYESLGRNKYLINNFFSNSVVIQISSSDKVELFDKINLVLPSLITSEFNEVYSGMYLVGGIIHSIQGGGIYKKMVSLHRNGMNKSDAVDQPRNK